MKKLALLCGIVAAFASSSARADLISEFSPNPDGSDPGTVQVELSGTANASFDLWLLSVESDNSSGAGLVDRVSNVTGTYDANGLAVVNINDLENPTFTFILAGGFTGDTSTDIDTDNDGVADDLSAFSNIMDAISISDTTGELVYGAQLGGIDFPFTGTEPEQMFRLGSTGGWIAVNNVLNASDGIFDEFGNSYVPGDFDSNPLAYTFGAFNPNFAIPEPTSAAIAGLALAGFGLIRRRK